MKRVIIYIICILASLNCVGQRIPSFGGQISLNLRQIEFADAELTQAITEITNSRPTSSSILSEGETFALFFYQSNFDEDEYLITIELFPMSKGIIKEIDFAYYLVINNRRFFVSKDISNDLFKVTSKMLNIRYDIPLPCVGPDYYFIIWKKNDNYHIIANTTVGE